MKVIIGVDGSEQASQAVRFTGRLLSSKVDDLLLFYSPPAFHLSSTTPVPDGVLRQAASALADGVFSEANSFLSSEMRTVTSTVQRDVLPADGLTDLAEQNDADLVVVGSKSGKRRFPFVLGSTARTAIHHTGKPVMVVRGNVKPNPEPLNVVIACDDDRWCDATGILRDLSWPANTNSTLLHVTETYGDQFADSLMTRGDANVPNATQLVQEYRDAIDRRKQAAEKQLLEAQKHTTSIIRQAQVEVQQGDIVDELVAKVERDDVDLLVLSSRRLGMIGRMLGSVTESLLSRCPCSLLIVHAEPPTGKATQDGDSIDVAEEAIG